VDRDARAFQAYLERPGRRRYARLVKRYYAFVWSVALRASGHREDALDLTHDLFLSLLRRPPAAGSVRSPRGYLATRVLTLLRRGRESAERRRLRELEAARRMAQRATPALDAADI
jgi:DNA-directed RNA polymerase specialized sigma24 family protein